jgi:hypothetical protein
MEIAWQTKKFRFALLINQIYMTALLEMRSITKEFPGVRALDGVTFDLRRRISLAGRRKRGGEIYADESLVGRLSGWKLRRRDFY